VRPHQLSLLFRAESIRNERSLETARDERVADDVGLCR
jgi:hypothetical protein